MLSVTLMFACAGLAVGLTAIWIVTDSSQKVRQETQEFVEDHAGKTTQSSDTANVKIKNLAVKLAKLEDKLLILSHVPGNTGKQLTSLNEDVAALKE
jgi:ribonuclease HI